jgi:hypothetical protein
MRISRLVLSGAAIGTIAGTALIPIVSALGYTLHRHGR